MGNLRGGYTYTSDAENRLTSTAGVSYTYDGDGWRVKKSNGKLYWCGVFGEILAETDLSGNNLREFVFFAGGRIARREDNGTIYYLFGDHLGSARVMSNSTGVAQQESDYYPFGGERLITNTVDKRYKFTGLERDSESGLDHTLFRMHASNLGRWLTPDPIAGSIFNPQSLNRYAYVVNNPTNFIDPLGLQDCASSRDPQKCRNERGQSFPPPSGSPYGLGDIGECYLDGAPAPCGMVRNLLMSGWAVLLPLPQIGSWIPLSNPGRDRDCPGCLWNPTTDEVWDPNSASAGASTSLPSGSFSGLMTWARAFIKKVPLDVTVVFPPVAGTFAYIPETNTVCIGGGAGVGVPLSKVAAGGPLVHGNVDNSRAVLSGWSWSGNAQLTPFAGYQAIWNSQGAVGGPTVATSYGASLTYMYSRCF